MRSAVLSASLAAAFALLPAPLAQLAEATVDSPDIGPHHRPVAWVQHEVSPDGQTLAVTHSYVELGAGLNYWEEASRRWLPAIPEFEQTQDGYFVARRTQHQVILSPDLAVEGAVDLLTPDGVRLRSTPLGIALLDTQSGRSVMLGEITSCKAEWVRPGEVIYRYAFDGLKAHVRYRLRLDAFEQDILLEEQIAPELVVELGLDPSRTRVVILTEFFEAPEPSQTRLAEGKDRLGFGAMQIGPGRAFRIEETKAEANAPVQPSWELLEGRWFLVESVEYAALAPLMDTLPLPDQGRIDALKGRVRRTAALAPRRLAPRQARAEGARQPAEHPVGTDGLGAGLVRSELRPWAYLAASAGPARGVVLDYSLELGSGQMNYLFKGDTTYYVKAGLAMEGTTTFEAGAVIKYAPTNSASLKLKGPIVWQGSPYRPVILTARDDTSVGDAVQSATNSLSGYYAAIALDIDRTTNTTAAILQHFRIAHAQAAIAINGRSGHVLSHGQFVHCQDGLKPSSNTGLDLRNVLFHDVTTVFNGSSSTGRCEFITVNTATTFNLNNTCNPLNAVNSLLAGVATNGQGSFTGSEVLTSASGVFQTVGQGANYLAAGSPYRNYAGASTSVNSELAAALKSLTTYPPIVLSNDFTVTTVLAPQAQWDATGRDLGYHYPPLDYCWSGLNLTNTTLILTNGVSVGFYGTNGLMLQNGARLISEGRAGLLNRLVSYSAAQEQSGVWGTSGAGCPFLATTNTPSPLPEVRLRFTDVSVLANADARRQWLAGSAVTPLAISESQMRGVYWTYASSSARTVGLTNTVWEQVRATWGNGNDLVTCYARNNLFRWSNLNLNASTAGNSWEWRDNAFDTSAAWVYYGAVSNSNNGYINSNQLNGTSNVVLSAFTYASGPLGSYYHGSTDFLDKGSRLASAAGLFHHTVKTDQTKDASTAVDIGFHYVATDANGNPLDTDGDGLPDYGEDRNGSGGNPDSGETDWQMSENGTTGTIGLQVFTPME